MINVVAFVGTAIRDGLVSRMCSRVLEGAADAGATTELINLYDHEIKHCIGCWSCYREGSCFHDDDFEALFTKLRDADAVVLGSPVYIGTMSGLMKTFFDRHNGVAVYNPDGAHEFHRLGLLDKLRTIRRAVKRFGPRQESMRGTNYVLVTASTLSFPYTVLTGQTRLALSALRALPRRLDGRVVARIVYTDSLVRCLEGKEARVMRRAYRAGQRIAHRLSM
jgi:putative NADPH-quinone reductase